MQVQQDLQLYPRGFSGFLLRALATWKSMDMWARPKNFGVERTVWYASWVGVEDIRVS